MYTYEVPDECPTNDIVEMWEWIEENYPDKYAKEGQEGWLIKSSSRDYELVDVY